MALAWVSATTTAIMSPTNRTTSAARGGLAMVSGAGNWARGFRPRSRERNTPTTPGIAAASEMSTLRRRACASVERTNTACRDPGRRTSSVYCPAPVTSRGSSRLRTAPPSAELTAIELELVQVLDDRLLGGAGDHDHSL